MSQIPQNTPWSIYPVAPTRTKELEKFGTVGRLLQNLETQAVPPTDTVAKTKPPLEKVAPQAPDRPAAPVDLLAQPSAKGRATENLAFADAPPAKPAPKHPLGPSQAALEAGRPPGQPGPFEVQKIEMTLAGQQVDVYLPQGLGPFPVNVYTTGLSHSRRHATANANHFASWGMVTVVPAVGGNVDPVKTGRTLEKILSELSQRSHLDRTAINPAAMAVSGHSFGGLSASLAADHPAVKALLALDPNDNLFQMNPGRRNASQVHVPAAFIFGDGGPNDLGPGIYHELSSSRKYAIEFKRMPHDNFISTAQMPNKRGQQRAMDFATAFLLHELGGLRATQPYLPEGEETRAAIRKGEFKPL